MQRDEGVTHDEQLKDTKTTQHIATFCHVSSNTCPKAFINNNAPEEKAIRVEDDFGNKIFMSKEQYEVMVTYGEKTSKTQN